MRTLVMQALTSLNAGIAGAAAHRHRVGRKVHPRLVILGRIAQTAGHHCGGSDSGFLVWTGISRRCNAECCGDRGEYRTGHPCGGPRHLQVPSLEIVVMGIPGPPPDPSPGIRCDAHARCRRFPSAFRPLAAHHPRLHHRPRRVTGRNHCGSAWRRSSRLGESSVTSWHHMATLGADRLGAAERG